MTVHLICGPVGAGKTTYVKNHLRPGDIVIDTDAIGRAVTGMTLFDYVFTLPRSILDIILPVRNGLVDLAVSYCLDGHNADVWITIGGANPVERQMIENKIRQLPYEIVIFEISHNLCRKHIQGDPERGDWRLWDPIIKKWWDTYQRRPGEKIISTLDMLSPEFH